MWTQTLGDPIIYWLLRTALMITLIISGYGISNKNSKGEYFWKWANPSLIAYSLIQGLRYMRGADYFHYMQDLEGNLWTEYKDPLYLLWLAFFQSTGLPYPVGFVFYSFLLFFSFLLIVKHFPKTAIWALPLFLLLTNSSENIIRQYFAICFIMFALHFYIEDKRRLMFICLIACAMIHFSGLFAIMMFLFFAYFRIENKIKMKKPWALIIIFLFVYFFWNNNYFKFVTEFLATLDLEENTVGLTYVENAERWFSEEGSIQLVLGNKAAAVSKIYLTAEFLSKSALIWFGWFAMKNNKQLSVVYWFTYLALLLDVISGDIEIYRRFYNWLVYLAPIMYGAIFVYYKWDKLWLRAAIVCLFIISYGFYGFIRQFGQIGYAGCAFIWDA